MKITAKLFTAISKACAEACGGRRSVEIGDRHWTGQTDDRAGMNFLLWGEDSDLDGTYDRKNAVGLEITDADGWVALDCYCYNLALFGREPDDALDCNCYVLIDARTMEVRYASCDDMGHWDAIEKITGRTWEAAGHE